MANDQKEIQKTLPVIWNGRKLSLLKKFEIDVIEMIFDDTKMGMRTILPITPAGRRNQLNSRASLEVIKTEDYMIFNIRDDDGRLFVMEIPQYMKDILHEAYRHAEKLGFSINL
jgi:hypothetical protein